MIPGRSGRANPAGGVSLRVAGFPTLIKPTFVILIAFVGWYPGMTMFRLAIWIAVASAAVMWHELGHAVAARRLGASPSIELYGFGGLTMWQPTADPSRRQLIGVSAAGPAAGFAVGAAMGVGVALAGGVGSGDVRYFVLVVLWTNVGWGLVNLLPIMPLDGGHILAEILPGDRSTRTRRAAIVSIVIAAIAGLFLISVGAVFGAIILAWAAMSNMSVLNAGRSERRRQSIEDDAREVLHRLARGDGSAVADAQGILARLRPHAATFGAVAIETAAAAGNAAAARELLDSVPDDQSPPPGIYALVFAAESGGRDGIAELVEIFRREPTKSHARWLAIALRWGGRLAEFAPIIDATDPPVDREVLAEAASIAEGLGNPQAALAIRSLDSHTNEGHQPF